MKTKKQLLTMIVGIFLIGLLILAVVYACVILSKSTNKYHTEPIVTTAPSTTGSPLNK